MNEFSVLCRVLGSLFYYQPQDPLLAPPLTPISEGKLSTNQPLEQGELFIRLQKNYDMPRSAVDYNALFVGDKCAVPPYRSVWVEGAKELDVCAFLSARGIPLADTPTDYTGTLSLMASWPENQSAEDENEALETLSVDYLLSRRDTFPDRVEAHVNAPFWRTAAPLTHGAIGTMWGELRGDIDEQM